MTGALLSSHLRKLALVLIAGIIFVDLCASIYHFTHGHGIYSGTTQLILAFVLLLSWYLIYIAHQYQPASKKYSLFRWIGLSLICITAIVLLSFGIYHFGTPTGTRSGVTETSLAFFLIVLDVLLYKAYKRPTGIDNL
jgi:O-antigen/teichoic acid export membrane protein